MPRIISTYIFKELLWPFLLGIAILTATALLSKVLKLTELLVTHGIGPRYILWFLVAVTPSFLIYTIPVSFLVSVLVAFTRLSSDSELIALRASGVGLKSLMRPVLFLALIAYLLTVVFTLYLFPWGNLSLKRLLFEVARIKSSTGIEEKTFYDRFKGMVLYVDHISMPDEELEGIFLSQKDEGGRSSVVFAKTGVFAPSPGDMSVLLKLYNGTIHREDRVKDTYHIAGFDTYTLKLDLSSGSMVDIKQKTNRELYPGELRERVKKVAERGEDPAPYIIDLHKRFALPASVFVFAILGVPLGCQRVRSARFTGFGTALAVVITYYVLSTFLEGLGENGLINPIFSVWGSDIIMGAAGLFLFSRMVSDRPLDMDSFYGRLRVLYERMRGRRG